MNPSVNIRRRLLQVLATTVAAWSVGGRAQPASPQPRLQQLRIGYQKSAVNLVILKQQGVLEKRFPDARVQWIEFPAGPQLLEALSVGLNPAKDAIAQESAKSPYVNLIAVREQDKDKPWVAKLVKAYHSDEVRKFIQSEFKGSIIAGF